MKIGILQCDDVRSSLSTEFGEYPTMIETPLGELDKDFEFETYKAHEGQLPDCVTECDAYILTGSRYSVLDTDALWINSLLDFVVRLHKANIATIGICFGYHLIAEAMGCKVERADMGWLIGVHRLNISHPQSFMSPAMDHVHLVMLSEDQVQEINDTVTVLAGSAKCPYAVLQFGDNMLGVQGRPEFSPKFAQRLLNLRKEEFPSKRFANGINSFAEYELDNAVMFSWFAQFILQRQIHTDENDESVTVEPS